MNLDAGLLEILACPDCKAPLTADDAASELVCTGPEKHTQNLVSDEGRGPRRRRVFATSGECLGAMNMSAKSEKDIRRLPGSSQSRHPTFWMRTRSQPRIRSKSTLFGRASRLGRQSSISLAI